MNNISIIRKNSYKDYLGNAVSGGFIIGLISFFISLTSNSALTSLGFGLAWWFVVIVAFMGIGFTSEEYFKRKTMIRKLQSDKYSFLHANGFILHEDFYFDGVYNSYHIRVLPVINWQGKKMGIKYDVIHAFYSFGTNSNEVEREKKLSGEYFIGDLLFANHCVGYVPKDWEKPDFKENLEGLISILKRENLKPLTNEDWESTFGIKLKEEEAIEEKSRTKQILKIGKLDIKIIKPQKKPF
jgi:hypothetical protein